MPRYREVNAEGWKQIVQGAPGFTHPSTLDVVAETFDEFDGIEPVTLLVRADWKLLVAQGDHPNRGALAGHDLHLEDLLQMFIEGMTECVAEVSGPGVFGGEDPNKHHEEVVRVTAEVGDWEYYGKGYFVKFTPLWTNVTWPSEEEIKAKILSEADPNILSANIAKALENQRKGN